MIPDPDERPLGASMRLIGWAAILAALPVTVDGRSIVGAPLAAVLAVLVWRLGATAPTAGARGALRLAAAWSVLVAAAVLAPWVDGVDLAGVSMLGVVAMAAGCSAYCVGIARWIAPWGWAGRVRWLHRSAAIQAVAATGCAAYVGATALWGSEATPRPGGATFTIAGTDVDSTILFGRTLPGVSTGAADVILLVVLLAWVVGLIVMAGQNRAISRRLLADDAAPAGSGPAGSEPGEAVAP